MYPSILLNLYRTDGYAFEADYLTSFVNDHNFYKTFTFVQFQRSATESHLKIFKHYIDHFRKLAKVPVIYEIDDLLRDIPDWNYASSYYNKDNSPVYDMMRLVDGMTTSTEKLKEVYSEYCNNIVVIPNHLPKFVWGEVQPKHLRASIRHRPNKVRIGWAGSENHFCNPKSKEFKSGVRGGDFGNKLIEFIKSTTDIYTWVMSGACPVELDDVRDKIEFHPWVSIFQYPNHVKSLDLDIGMAILKPCLFNDCKCLVGNTKVISNDGIMDIKDIKKDQSLYQEGSFENVSSNVKYTNQKTIKITTKLGYSIEGTPNHKISSNGKYIRLDELNMGDKVDLSFFEYPDIPYVKEVAPFFLTKKLDSIDLERLDDSMLPTITLNERWGYFLGIFLGDGNIGQNESVNISCDSRENIVDLMYEFGKSIGLNVNIRKGDKRNTNGTCVHFGSRNLKWLLSNRFGFNGGKFKKNLNVPIQIWKSPKSVVREFIKGLFDADGTTGYTDHSTGISFTTKNKQLAEEIQLLLLGFGIISGVRDRFNTKYQRTYYTLFLNRQASDIFYKEIGFACIKKQEKLKNIISKPHSNKYKEWEMNDEIVDIQTGYNDVYDVEIPNNHFYVANGFVSHNSNIKCLEYNALGIPAVYSNAEPYKDMTLTSDDEDGIISYIEKLAKYTDYRQEIFEKDYAIVKDQLFWEGIDGKGDNLRAYVNSYLSLFKKRLED